MTLPHGKYNLDLSFISDNMYYIPKKKIKVEGKEFEQPEANLTIATWLKTDFEYDGQYRLTFFVFAPDIEDTPVQDRTVNDLPTDFDTLQNELWQELIPR